jgi:isopentenyl-diphosphate Delta-isomerase
LPKILLLIKNMQELNIVNENDEVIGNDTRQNIHKNGLLHREIHIWIFNDRGEVILQKRAANKDTYPGLWDVSVGGHVEIGDDYETTAIRELEEETGLKVKKEDLIFLEKTRRSSVDAITGMKNNTIRHIYAYRYNGPADELRLETGKATSLKFWPINRIFNLGEEEKKEFIPLLFKADSFPLFDKIKALIK